MPKRPRYTRSSQHRRPENKTDRHGAGSRRARRSEYLVQDDLLPGFIPHANELRYNEENQLLGTFDVNRSIPGSMLLVKWKEFTRKKSVDRSSVEDKMVIERNGVVLMEGNLRVANILDRIKQPEALRVFEIVPKPHENDIMKMIQPTENGRCSKFNGHYGCSESIRVAVRHLEKMNIQRGLRNMDLNHDDKSNSRLRSNDNFEGKPSQEQQSFADDDYVSSLEYIYYEGTFTTDNIYGHDSGHFGGNRHHPDFPSFQHSSSHMPHQPSGQPPMQSSSFYSQGPLPSARYPQPPHEAETHDSRFYHPEPKYHSEEYPYTAPPRHTSEYQLLQDDRPHTQQSGAAKKQIPKFKMNFDGIDESSYSDQKNVGLYHDRDDFERNKKYFIFVKCGLNVEGVLDLRMAKDFLVFLKGEKLGKEKKEYRGLFIEEFLFGSGNRREGRNIV